MLWQYASFFPKLFLEAFKTLCWSKLQACKHDKITWSSNTANPESMLWYLKALLTSTILFINCIASQFFITIGNRFYWLLIRSNLFWQYFSNFGRERLQNLFSHQRKVFKKNLLVISKNNFDGFSFRLSIKFKIVWY